MGDSEKTWLEAIGIMHEFATKTDEINLRLIITIRIIVIAFLIAIVTCFGILYISDYTTTNMQQQISGSQMQQQQK
jgi:hypothetical protein